VIAWLGSECYPLTYACVVEETGSVSHNVADLLPRDADNIKSEAGQKLMDRLWEDLEEERKRLGV
jgi:hypothetical protein